MSRVYHTRDQSSHLLTPHGEAPRRFIPAGARQPGKGRRGAAEAGSARRRSERPGRVAVSGRGTERGRRWGRADGAGRGGRWDPAPAPLRAGRRAGPGGRSGARGLNSGSR